MSKEITLRHGQIAIVDDADYEWLNQWQWSTDSSGYAYRHVYIDGTNRSVYMHRVILNAPHKSQVDHVNHEKLDNRRCNLRIVTQSQNNQNAQRRVKAESAFKGVKRRGNRWEAYIVVDSKRMYLGLHLTQRSAAHAYNLAASQYFGEFACLNDLDTLSPQDDPPMPVKRKDKRVTYALL